MKDLLDEVQRLHRAGLLRRRLRDRRDVPGLARSYGAGVTNYLAVPDLPTRRQGRPKFDFPGGTIFDGDLPHVQADHVVRGPVLPEERVGVDRARLVRRRLAAAPVRGGHRPEVPRLPAPTASTPGSSRRASTASVDAGRAARAGAGRLRARARADQAAGRRRRSRRPARSPAPSSRRPCCTRRSAATPRA